MDKVFNQKMNVQWNNHLQSFGTAFPRLFLNQRFVDVTLACEGRRIHCHRVVLAACSSYFEELLDENPAQHPIIILPKDVKFWALQALVDFMYRGEVNVMEVGFDDLVKAAELLNINCLNRSSVAQSEKFYSNSWQEGNEEEEDFENYTNESPAVQENIKTERAETHYSSFTREDDFPTMHMTDMRDMREENFETNPQTDAFRSDDAPRTSKVSIGKVKKRSSQASWTPNPLNLLRKKEEILKTEDKKPKVLSNNFKRTNVKFYDPPENFILTPATAKGGGQRRRHQYSREAMWSAMMCVNAGESLYQAGKIYKIPTGSLHYYTERYGIRSSFLKKKLKLQAEGVGGIAGLQ
ncbi:hypothetical protein DMENIID0001_136000 [Sergentomyia squamirostris]